MWKKRKTARAQYTSLCHSSHNPPVTLTDEPYTLSTHGSLIYDVSRNPCSAAFRPPETLDYQMEVEVVSAGGGERRWFLSSRHTRGRSGSIPLRLTTVKLSTFFLSPSLSKHTVKPDLLSPSLSLLFPLCE